MARLESFMVPRDVVFVPELPKTTTAKVSRRLLRDIAAQPAPAESTARG
jgi:acyl-coenzyme A synthetase/AMP-(fatty) acid ligase